MTSLVFHKATQKQIDRIVNRPVHALLLLAQNGAGKGSIASHIAASILQTEPARLATHPYVHWLQPTNNTISIDNIRAIQRFLQLKTTGDQPIRRIVCIERAEAMTQEAQNALLKMLEEPPPDTIIILTAQHKQSLLPTILSRTQVVSIQQPTQAQLEVHFSHEKDSTEVRKAYFLSGGLPGLMHGILTNDHPLLRQVVVAKDLLQRTPFERLAIVDSLTKQPEERDLLLDALERIARSGLTQAGKTANTAQLKKWHGLQKQTFAAKEALAKNANAKLVLTNMFLNF